MYFMGLYLKEGDSVQKSSEKILNLIKDNNQITILDLSNYLGISTRAIEKNIFKLKEEGLLKRVGPDKGGYSEVIEK